MKSKKILIWTLFLILLLLVFFIVRGTVGAEKLPVYVFPIIAGTLILMALAVAYLPRFARRSGAKKAAVAAGYTVTKKGFTLSLEKGGKALWLFIAPHVGAGKTVCFINRHQYCTFLLIRADNRGRNIFRNPMKNVKRPDTTAFAEIVDVPVEGVTAEKVVLFARMTPLFHVIVHKEEQPLKPGDEVFGMRVTDTEHLTEIL